MITHGTWKLIKLTQMRTNKGYLFRAWYSKGFSYHCLYWVETQKSGKCGSFKVKKGSVQECSDQRLLAWRSWRWAKYE